MLAAAAGAIAFLFAGRTLFGLISKRAHLGLDASAPARVVENLGVNLRAAWRILAPASMAGAITTLIACALVYFAVRSLRWPPPLLPGAGGRIRSGLPMAAALASLCGAVAYVLYGVAGQRFVLPIVSFLLLLLGEKAECSSRPGVRRVATALLGCLVLVQVVRGGYWIRYSLSTGPAGIEWTKRLVPACAPEDAGCTFAPDEIAPPDFPWIDRGFGRRVPKGAASP